MPVPNPLYDPDFEETHEKLVTQSGELRRQMQEIRAQQHELYNQGITNGHPDYDALEDQHTELGTRYDEALEAINATYKTQHETVGEYAEYVFGTHDVEMASIDGRPVPHEAVNFEDFQSVEEVDQAWARVSAGIKETSYAQAYSLPTGQPNGMDIFEERGDNQVFSYERTFQPEELFGYNNGFMQPVSTIITVDQRADGETHVSFMHDYPANLESSGVMNNFENLATAVYREAQVLANMPQDAGSLLAQDGKPPLLETNTTSEERSSVAGRLVSKIVSGVSGLLNGEGISSAFNSSDISPDKFHFYYHSPASAGGLSPREQFMSVPMSFTNGSFSDPQWGSHYDVIPEAVQNAKESLMRDMTYGASNAPISGNIGIGRDDYTDGVG